MSLENTTRRRCCPVIELRQYTLKAGQRNVLIDLFDRYFVESQEAAGMTVIGQFRDRARPERFVWMRGFADMATRHRALERFYDGPVWAAHKTAANDTMLDFDNVLLLRPARPETAFVLDDHHPDGHSSRVLAAIYELPAPAGEALLSRVAQDLAPRMHAIGVDVQGVFVSETAPNTFTRLPVRTGGHVLVWLGTPTRTEPFPALEAIAAMSAFDGAAVVPTLLDLEPTSRSSLGNGPHAARATRHDFDFLLGSWHIHNRCLKRRLQDSTEWIEFDAQSEVEPLLDGLGQLDRFSAVRQGETIQAVTLRLFNPATGEWSLHWADTVRAGVLLPPVVGRFRRDIGEFFGEETVDGRNVPCRFHWFRTSADVPRWEQAFSGDGGRTWETNWVMTFHRR